MKTRSLFIWLVVIAFLGCTLLSATAAGIYGLRYLSTQNTAPQRSAHSTETTRNSIVMAANLNLRNSGMVENNYDGGDAVMGTIVFITRNDPVTDPALFLVAPGYSIDVEYLGDMYFTADNYDGKATSEQAAALAKYLHDNAEAYLYVGPKDLTPEGFTFWQDADGWFALKDWKYAEKPIEPKGLTCSESIFVSATQTERDLKAGEGVIYGQFWTTANPGYVVHIQVRQGENLTVPTGWQGTYWIWTGNLKQGELELQKRLIQAVTEAVSRDDIKGVQLLIAGNLPANIDPSITSLEFHGETVTWQTSVESWK